MVCFQHSLIVPPLNGVSEDVEAELVALVEEEHVARSLLPKELPLLKDNEKLLVKDDLDSEDEEEEEEEVDMDDENISPLMKPLPEPRKPTEQEKKVP